MHIWNYFLFGEISQKCSKQAYVYAQSSLSGNNFWLGGLNEKIIKNP